MKISECIAQLIALMLQHGDVEVMVLAPEGNWEPLVPDELTVIAVEITRGEDGNPKTHIELY